MRLRLTKRGKLVCRVTIALWALGASIYGGVAEARESGLAELREHREEMREAQLYRLRRMDAPDMRAWRVPEPPRPRPVAPVRVQAAPSRATGSTNAYVAPWGCEASHSQQWSPSGRYWGKYQFDRQTWQAHGGSPGSYGSASEAEQDAVAARVRYDAWPNC